MTPEFAFCADDFTGASDTLATVSRAGLSARLFLRVDDAVAAARTEAFEAIGLATPLRAMEVADARAMIRGIAPAFASLGARFAHFKICSTFDSSPDVGNIAAVADLLAEALAAEQTLVIGGQPSLKRYCAFGNLFAAAGDGTVHRIDRHPTMSVHPVTPMTEADLRRHFARLGWDGMSLVDVTAFAAGVDRLAGTIEAHIDRGDRRLLLDAMQESDVTLIGEALRAIATRRRLLLVGSSSVAEALFPSATKAFGQAQGPRLDGPVFAFAGSRSAVTAAQVAEAKCYDGLMVDPDDILSDTACAKSLAKACKERLRAGSHVLVQLSGERGAAGGHALAMATGRFIQRIVEEVRPGCLVIAGGDTSSAAIDCLGVESISFVADIDRGVPLVRAHGRNGIDGMPMILKGGQVGGIGLFDTLAGLSQRRG